MTKFPYNAIAKRNSYSLELFSKTVGSYRKIATTLSNVLNISYDFIVKYAGSTLPRFSIRTFRFANTYRDGLVILFELLHL